MRRMLTGQEAKRGAVVASTPSRRASFGTAVPELFGCTSEAAGHGRWDAATGRLRRGRSVQMRLSRGGSHSSRETDTQKGHPRIKLGAHQRQTQIWPPPIHKKKKKKAAKAASRHEGEVAEYASCRSGCGCGCVAGWVDAWTRACVCVWLGGGGGAGLTRAKRATLGGSAGDCAQTPPRPCMHCSPCRCTHPRQRVRHGELDA